MATLKQKMLVKKVLENKGNKRVSVSQAMKEVGYSDSLSKNPQIVTKSKGFQELLEKYLPDDLILGAIEEDINEGSKGNRSAILSLASKIKGYEVKKLDLTSGGHPLSALIDEIDSEE